MSKEPVKIEAVCVGAEFCKCGGMMELTPGNGLLMSAPPQVKVNCPFCGETNFVLAPYEVKISFMKSDIK